MGAHDALFNICAKRKKKKKITVCCNKRLTHELLASPEMAPANGRRQDAIYTRSTIFSKTELPKRKSFHEIQQRNPRFLAFTRLSSCVMCCLSRPAQVRKRPKCAPFRQRGQYFAEDRKPRACGSLIESENGKWRQHKNKVPPWICKNLMTLAFIVRAFYSHMTLMVYMKGGLTFVWVNIVSFFQSFLSPQNRQVGSQWLRQMSLFCLPRKRLSPRPVPLLPSRTLSKVLSFSVICDKQAQKTHCQDHLQDFPTIASSYAST